MSIVYCNNQYVPAKEANINIGDRAYLFGDGVYEAFLYSNGEFIDFDKHIERLHNSLKMVQINNFALLQDELKDISTTLIKKNNVSKDEQRGVYFYISRETRFPREHNYSKEHKPSFVAFLIDTPPCDNRLDGIKIKTYDDIRWKLRGAKTTMLMANVMIKHDSINNGYDDGLFVEDGVIRELSASNIFFLTNKGEFVTPKSDGNILAGVTRWRILQMLNEQGFSAKECDISYSDLNSFVGAFSSASITRIKPIIQIDDTNYNSVHTNIQKIITLYEEYVSIKH